MHIHKTIRVQPFQFLQPPAALCLDTIKSWRDSMVGVRVHKIGGQVYLLCQSCLFLKRFDLLLSQVVPLLLFPTKIKQTTVIMLWPSSKVKRLLFCTNRTLLSYCFDRTNDIINRDLFHVRCIIIEIRRLALDIDREFIMYSPRIQFPPGTHTVPAHFYQKWLCLLVPFPLPSCSHLYSSSLSYCTFPEYPWWFWMDSMMWTSRTIYASPRLCRMCFYVEDNDLVRMIICHWNVRDLFPMKLTPRHDKVEMESSWIEIQISLGMKVKVNQCIEYSSICTSTRKRYCTNNIDQWNTFVVDSHLLNNPKDTKSIQWFIFSRRKVSNSC